MCSSKMTFLITSPFKNQGNHYVFAMIGFMILNTMEKK